MRILTISAHPDDETLGCGGTLLKHQASGDSVYWLIVTQTYEPQWTKKEINQKATEIDQVSKAYGMKQYFKLGFPTVKLDTVPYSDLIGSIRKIISEVKPNIIYLVHPNDVHTDHNVVFTATMSVVKPFYMKKFGVKRILCFETLSSTETAPTHSHKVFTPNLYHDISPFIERKIEIMGLFESEAQDNPMPRGPSAIRALARHRGATVGVEYAEAFELVRELI
ncbi:MAG: PIG-L deacetylase family protein [Candidatus Thorarchaeota archaeon]